MTPHNLAQHRDEDVAIMADLHRWRAKDPLYKHPDNPWRGIYGIYANRMIAVPGGGRTVKRSVPGTPVRTRRYAADKWYMFNEILADIGVSERADASSTASSQEDDQLSEAFAQRIAEATLDVSVYNMAIYWPEGLRDNYDPEKLIPALESRIAGGRAWSGMNRFLVAARNGQAREYIARERAQGVEFLTAKLLAGSECALADARRAGFKV